MNKISKQWTLVSQYGLQNSRWDIVMLHKYAEVSAYDSIICMYVYDWWLIGDEVWRIVTTGYIRLE